MQQPSTSKKTQQQQHQQQNVTNVSVAAGDELRKIRDLLWGANIRNDVFSRWSQGFEFSEAESSALLQKQGGPCAVLAPVQAHLIKILIMDMPNSQQLHKLDTAHCKQLLVQALCAILSKCSRKCFKIVSIVSSSSLSDALLAEEFHNSLTARHFATIDDVKNFYMSNYELLELQFGVLLFLYSVLLTRGIETVLNDLSDTSEPLIHSLYGYGSQALINLMLTGQAVAHVWDNEQDVGGLKLRGISEQSEIGFITLMEQMRYCTVGSFYKNPRHPVWVMGSETHLTVLFSFERKLVSPETASETARRVFKSYDPDGNNFIPTAVLQDVLNALSLVSEPEYVDIMRKRLDPEGLGVILLNAFMDEYYPLESSSTPDTFDLWHYNGIPGSNEGNKVYLTKSVNVDRGAYVGPVIQVFLHPENYFNSFEILDDF